MKALLRQFYFGVVTLLLLSLAPAAQACATCFGKSDSKLAEGVNWGILTLLFIVMGVLGAISAFFVFIARRSAAHQSNVR
jgi:heme/copper-type cytochrome/quinol oxidase subunit 2